MQAKSELPIRQLSAAESDRQLADRLRLLCKLELFRNLSVEQLLPLAEMAVAVTYATGEAIVQQGDPGDCVYIIADGEVEVLARSTQDAEAREAVVAWLVTGDALGEMALLDGEPRSATCRAVTQTLCLRLERKDFLGALQQYWPLTQELLAVLAHRLRMADRLLAEHARDPLTGLNSRRKLQDVYDREVQRVQRAAQRGDTARPALALLFADINDFKSINDQHGHVVGDGVLRSVAMTLSAVSRASDFVARYGGDEFVMLLPEAGADGAARVASRIRQLLRDHPPGPVPFSMSIGTTILDADHPTTLESLLTAADSAMYLDKALGKDETLAQRN